MTKKFITSLLVTVVFAGLVLFAYNQIAAQTAPTDAERIINCSGEALRLRFDTATGGLTAAYWCSTDAEGNCVTAWTPLTLRTGYLVDGDDVRQIVNSELLYWCQGPLGGCIGGNCFPKFP